MKQILLQVILLLPVVLSFGQKKAVTENGEEVILYNDGTWKYINDSVTEKKTIPTNTKMFSKGNSSTFLVKSSRFNAGVWIDAKKWSFKKPANDQVAEYEFELKGKDVYGIMITEKIEVPLETLKTIALQNGKEAAPDIRIVREEYRTVNNKKVLLLQMNGTVQGIKFTYYGYYYSSPKGTIQFLAYTAQNLFDGFVTDMEEFLNGFVTLE